MRLLTHNNGLILGSFFHNEPTELFQMFQHKHLLG